MNWRYTAALIGFVLLIVSPQATPLAGPAIIDITQTQIRYIKSSSDTTRYIYQLYNKRLGVTAIGYSLLTCVFVGRGGPLDTGVSECSAVYALKRGKIVAHGILKRRLFYGLAVVGGTGIYSNIGGQMNASTIRSRPHEERLLFGLET